mmetsp:Transcript_8247/g.19396  ORF Transcript_8247/g.19396 Transcript_8247/m.19396 type:complete len:215 (-) Transcript_8247:884-1528(-)
MCWGLAGSASEINCFTCSPSNVSPPKTSRMFSSVMTPEWSASNLLKAACRRWSCKGIQVPSIAARKSEYCTSASLSKSMTLKMCWISSSGTPNLSCRAFLSSHSTMVPCLFWSIAKKYCLTRARSSFERLQAMISMQQRRNLEARANSRSALTTKLSTSALPAHLERRFANQGCSSDFCAESRRSGFTCSKDRTKSFASLEMCLHCLGCIVYLP